jgi:hypothetical protein
MDRSFAVATIMGAPQGFAIQGDDLGIRDDGSRLDPRQEALLKLLGSRAAKTRPKVSWEGMPLGKSKKVRNQTSLAFPNSSISTQLSAPQITAHTAITMISSRWWCLVRSTRGSLSGAKWSRRPATGE